MLKSSLHSFSRLFPQNSPFHGTAFILIEACEPCIHTSIAQPAESKNSLLSAWPDAWMASLCSGGVQLCLKKDLKGKSA